MSSASFSIPVSRPSDDSEDYGYSEEVGYVESDDVYYRKQARFYPICIGDVFRQTYRIDHKLGQGGFSTVWLAYNLEKNNDVALKVMASGASGDHEYNVQKAIQDAVRDTSQFILFQDTFLIRGENTNHRVFVYPVRGPSFSGLLFSSIPMSTRMLAAKQLLEALANLHKHGFIHRDINSGNLLFGIDFPKNLSKKEKYQIFGRPAKEPTEATWRRGELVEPMRIPGDRRRNTSYLGDFGLTVRAGQAYHLLNIAPQNGFTLYYGSPVFLSLNTMVKLLGPLPKSFKGRYKYGKAEEEWYTQDGSDPGNSFELVLVV